MSNPLRPIRVSIFLDFEPHINNPRFATPLAINPCRRRRSHIDKGSHDTENKSFYIFY